MSELTVITEPKSNVVAYQPHAFSSYTNFVNMPAGCTVGGAVRALNLPKAYDGHLRVWLGDRPIELADWETTRPLPGEVLYVSAVPHGGGGGKDILRIIAMIAIAVVAIHFAPVLAGTGVAGASTAGMTLGAKLLTAGVAAGLTILGNLALNAIIPPPKPSFDAGGGLGSRRNQLTGSSNRFAPYAPIPRIFGKRRVYPMLVGRPYSESQGKDEYLRMALMVGWGPLQISDIRIGDTPITSFADVDIEVLQGYAADPDLTLYTNIVNEDSFAVELAPSVANQRTTQTGVNEISIDVVAPAGLCRFSDSGKRLFIELDVEVRYRAVGSGTWLTPVWLRPSTEDGTGTNGVIRMKGNDTALIRRAARFSVPLGQYEVRLTRTSALRTPESRYTQDLRWTQLRSIKPSYPVLQEGLCLIALRMKATGQLNGVPQVINCIAESLLPVYNGTAWNYAVTRNPAWAFCDVLRRRGGETYLADDRIDLPTIQAWAAACDAVAPNATEARWSFDGVIEGGSVFSSLRQIAASARAQYVMRDGKHSVIRDIQQTIPIQHITPRNSSGYSGAKVFLDYPHALRVVFTNAAKNYEEDEVIVYDDGYTSANATRFETLELLGCTSATQAWREGRYHIAAARLRPEEHTVQMDVENVRCTLGDLVQFQHDVISIGIASARVRSMTLDGLSRVISITLDQQVPIETTKSYALRVRKADGSSVVVSLQSPSNAETDTVLPTTALIAANAPEVGDLVMFGEAASVAAPMLVKSIEAGPELTATLRLVDAQSGVYTADTGSIPAFNSNITIVNPIEEQRPTAVVISALRSDETVILLLSDGTLQDRIAVDLSLPESDLLRTDAFEVQWRAVDGAVWEAQRFLRGAPIYITSVQTGVAYEVRARSLSEAGVAGDWSITATHTVVGKSTPPADATGLGYTASEAGIAFAWDASADIDYSTSMLRYGASWASSTLLFDGAATSFVWARPAAGTYTVFLKHKDTTGLESANAISVGFTYSSIAIANSGITLTSAGALQGAGGGAIALGSVPGALTSTQIGAIIDETKFAPNVEPVKIITTTLPTTKSTSAIFFSGKLYRWNGTAYVAEVPAADITGLLAPAQLDLSIGGGNLLYNSSFEADADVDGFADGWEASSFGTGITVARTQSATALFGSKSFSVQVSAITGASTNAQVILQDLASMPSVIAGKTYSLSLWCNVTTLAYEPVIGVQFLDAVNTQLGYTQFRSALAATNAWERISVTATAPAGAVKARPRFGFFRPSAADATLGTALFDGIQLEEGNFVTAYAPRPTELLPGTITATEIANDAITSPKIIAGAITTGKIAAGAVTANEIAANTITAAKIAAGTITATEIAANTITASKIAAGTITATEIAADTITAGKIAAGAIGADEIAANAVTTGKLFVTGRGAALNADPNASDTTAWVVLAGTLSFATGLTDVPGGGSTALQNNSGASVRTFSSDLIPVDAAKNYRMECYMLTASGTASPGNYFAIAWYSSTGASLDASAAQPAGAGNPAGWTLNGTYSYGNVSNQTLPGTWTRYVFSFGPSETAKIPTNARFMRIGALLNVGNFAQVVRATGIRLTEKAAGELIVDGSITAQKMNVTALSAIAADVGTLTAGVIRNAADTFRVDVTNGRTIVQTGSYMKVTGAPFGSTSQFIEWYGPYQANLANCTEANATYYLKTTGAAYFGGTLSAGTLTNKGATTLLASNAEITVGPFGTNGNSKSVVLSYGYVGNWAQNQASSSGSASGTISATVKLYRKIGTAAETEVATLNVTGSWAWEIDPEPMPGPTYIKAWSQSMSGSLTYTDSVSGVEDRTYRAAITARSIAFAPPNGTHSQITQIISTEQ